MSRMRNNTVDRYASMRNRKDKRENRNERRMERMKEKYDWDDVEEELDWFFSE
jgi:hypothetical protein